MGYKISFKADGHEVYLGSITSECRMVTVGEKEAMVIPTLELAKAIQKAMINKYSNITSSKIEIDYSPNFD